MEKATVTNANINKMKDALGKLGPYASKLIIKGQYTITETENWYTFKPDNDKEDTQFYEEDNLLYFASRD